MRDIYGQVSNILLVLPNLASVRVWLTFSPFGGETYYVFALIIITVVRCSIPHGLSI